MTAPTPLHELSIAEAGRRLRDGSVSSTSLTQHGLARIASLDPLLHSFVLVTAERALADADRADRELRSDIDRGPMHGIPYALKDIYFQLFNACGRVVLIAEAYAIHEQDLLSRPLDYARYTYQRMMAGATLSAADLTQALRLRRELSTVVNVDILGSYDAIITANGLTPAPRIDEFRVDVPPMNTLQTIPFNVTGNPVLAIPTGFSSSGLPLGMQIVGRAFDEPTVLRIGAAYEAAAGWIAKRPSLELPIAV